MVRLAFATLRARKGSFIGTFIASVLAVALITSSGLLMESALRGSPGANQFAAADAVITAQRDVTIQFESGKKHKIKTKSKGLKEGVPNLPADLLTRLKGTSG